MVNYVGIDINPRNGKRIGHDVTLQSEFHANVSHDHPIWISHRIGGIESGEYSGSEVFVPGASIAFEIKKDGEHVASVTFELNELMAIALVAIDKAPHSEEDK